MEIKGYKTIGYSDLLVTLGAYHADYLKDGGSEFKLADQLKVKTIQTVRNCFSPQKQIVADAILTKLMEGVGFDGFVQWKNGERQYYIKNGK